MRPFRRDILEENVEEAAFLFRMREYAFDSHARRLASLEELEERLLAHLAGVTTAASAGWEVARRGLGSKDDGEAFVAGFAAVSAPSHQSTEELAGALSSPKGARGHRRGLRLARGLHVRETLGELTKHKEITVRSAAWDALVFRGEVSEVDELRDYLRSETPEVVRSGLEIAARIRPKHVEAEIARAADHPDPTLATAAHRAALLTGAPAAHRTGAKLAASSAPGTERALVWHGLAGAPDALTTLIAAAEKPGLHHAAFLTVAHAGLASEIERFVRATAEPTLARAAGRALELLCGIDLVQDALVLPPDRIPSVESDDLDLDEPFAWPDPDRIRSLWTSGGLRPTPPASWEKLLQSTEDAPLPTREATIVRCRLAFPSVPPFETRGWADEQRRAFPRFAEQVAQASRGRPSRN